ncbi:hypothetical protein AUP68_07294 [Ilyonectria robusta]
MKSCAFCQLIITTFTSDFNPEFQLLLDRASSLSPPQDPAHLTRFARELPGGVANVSFRPVESSPGLVKILIQRSVPKISELKPQAAWFSLDTRPKDHGTVTLWENGPHFIRIWLSAAYNGRIICHTLLHEPSRSGQPEMGRSVSLKMTKHRKMCRFNIWTLSIGQLPSQLWLRVARMPTRDCRSSMSPTHGVSVKSPLKLMACLLSADLLGQPLKKKYGPLGLGHCRRIICPAGN